MMVDNPVGKVAFPALATTAYMAKQSKKRKSDYQDNHLKENASQVKGGEEEGVAEMLP